jgi:uncharacterized protein YqgV (UPF0045/DUF77 family)
MNITAEVSLYPLTETFVTPIRDFILELRRQPGIEVVTNQMSTQIRGDFDAVTTALNRGMRQAMQHGAHLAFVVKYLSADLPIGTTPRIEPAV